MNKFDGMLICTDLDGTLLKNDLTISKENTEAIEYFKNNGGYFTFITGRMPFFVSDMCRAVRPNAPFGCVNGGGLYDYINEKYIWHAELSRDVIELVECIDRELPHMGIQVNTFYETYFCKENEAMANFRAATGLPNLVCKYNEVSVPFAKIVFASDDDRENDELERILKAHPMAENFDFIRSEKTLFEILPRGIGKGMAIKKLTDFLNTDINKTVAIGDYNNDISMFKAAKIGIAVNNACPEAKEAADYITVSNEENAIAQIIYNIENGKYTF